jgi:RES domain
MSEIRNKWICYHCVSETYLPSEIKRTGSMNACDYCNAEVIQCWLMSSLAERVKLVFDANYQLSDSEPEGYYAAMHHDPEVDYDWEREGDEIEDLLEEILCVEREVVNDLIELWRNDHGYRHNPQDDGGSEDSYGYEARYVEKPFDRHLLSSQWDNLILDIRHKSRFFSEIARSFLGHIFENIETLSVSRGNAIKTLGDKDTIYRARIAWGWEEQKKIIASPQTELCSPPKQLARAGRLNAAGISVFYGAFDVKTCLAEVRAPVGASVVSAQFKPIKPLRLLDIQALERIYSNLSMFDPRCQEEGEKMLFLRGFSKKISAPVMPNDESLDYVITQVVFEFLSTLRPRLDGILYHSVQDGNQSLNVALFSHASRIKSGSNFFDSDVDVQICQYSDDEDNVEISVSRTATQGKSTSTTNEINSSVSKSTDFSFDDWSQFDDLNIQSGNSNAHLEFVEGSLELFTIQAIDYKTTQTYIRQN